MFDSNFFHRCWKIELKNGSKFANFWKKTLKRLKFSIPMCGSITDQNCVIPYFQMCRVGNISEFQNFNKFLNFGALRIWHIFPECFAKVFPLNVENFNFMSGARLGPISEKSSLEYWKKFPNPPNLFKFSARVSTDICSKQPKLGLLSFVFFKTSGFSRATIQISKNFQLFEQSALNSKNPEIYRRLKLTNFWLRPCKKSWKSSRKSAGYCNILKFSTYNSGGIFHKW